MSTCIVTPINQPVETIEPNTPLNQCSHLSLDRHAGAFPSLAELRTQVHSRIFESVAHIRMLLALEDAI
jgi:hypothetical protein